MIEKHISADRVLLNKKNEALKQREIFTDKDACIYLKCSSVTLWRERKKGKICFRRVASKIVYLREDLDQYLEQNKRGGFAIVGGNENA